MDENIVGSISIETDPTRLSRCYDFFALEGLVLVEVDTLEFNGNKAFLCLFEVLGDGE